jgi:ER membrane protein complex subunit 1
MRSMFGYATALALYLAPWATHVCALHASEAGVLDWYTPLVGKPIVETLATAPTFHRVTGDDGTSESVILAATESNVLAGVSPVNGSLGKQLTRSEGRQCACITYH